MRPYMLWLTRVYGGSVNGYAKAFLAWPNVLEDWLRRCAEDRFRNERALRSAPRPTSPALDRAIRRGTMAESRRPGAGLLAEWRRALSAGQGGR